MPWYMMGGYAIYVWSAYAVVMLVVGGGIVWSRGRLRRGKDAAS